MSTETVKKYLVELRFVEIEVDKDSMEEGYMEYQEVDFLDSEELIISDDYDRAQKDYITYSESLNPLRVWKKL